MTRFHPPRYRQRAKRAPIAAAAPIRDASRGVVLKREDEHRLVIGVALESDRVDLQGDVISVPEMIRTAMRSLGAGVKINHEGGSMGRLVMSLVLTPDVRKAILSLPEGPTFWLVGLEVTDPETWQRVKNGELSGGLSIGGRLHSRSAT